MTLKGHENKPIQTMSYFPDGKQMVSVSFDKTARPWDLQTGEEVEKARDVCEHGLHALTVSRDGRWVITASGNSDHGELKACEVETGIVKNFQPYSETITCIDISADRTLLASGSWDSTIRTRSLDTGKLVAGPIKSVLTVMLGAVRFSQNSEKLAVNGWTGRYLEVWDVKTQKLDRKVGTESGGSVSYTPVFWTQQ
jgi:WD40 repeat protein